MEWAFLNDDVTVHLKTKVVLTGGDPIRMKYEKPDGTIGYLAATVCPTNDTYAQVSTSFDVAGTWRVQVYAVLAGEKFHGLWDEIKVYSPLC